MLVFGGVKVPEITRERYHYDSVPKLEDIGYHVVTLLDFSLICIAYSLDLLPPRMPVTTRIITFLVALGIQSPNVSGWLGCPITFSAKYLGSITILRRWLDPQGRESQPKPLFATIASWGPG